MMNVSMIRIMVTNAKSLISAKIAYVQKKNIYQVSNHFK